MTLTEAVKALGAAGIENPLYDARQIFCRIGGIPMASLVLGGEVPDGSEAHRAVIRRAERVPLEYIIGNVDFYRENYLVNECCLIPRDDTEILVDYAVRNMPRGARFADLCTGSGCVALSVLNNTDATNAVMVDISECAIAVAKENAKRLGLAERAELVVADVLGDALGGAYHAVLSNPPYVRRSDYEHLSPEIKHEPRIAFVGGEDGLDFYRRITELYRKSLAPGGYIAFEIGYDQGPMLVDIAKSCGMRCRIIPDLAGNDRVAVLDIER